MSTYLISDIHGNNEIFRKALKSIKLKKEDHLILLGDLIDRGPDSKGVLDTIFLLLENGFKVTCIKGNHEQMLLDAFNDITKKVNWFRNGGRDTLKSFMTSEITRIPEKYIHFISEMDYYIFLGNFILVHAGIDMTKDDPLSDHFSLLWLRNWKSVYNEEWLGNKMIIHGHTPMKRGEIQSQIVSKQKIIGIDNGIYLKEEDGFGGICVFKLDDLSFHFEY